MQTVHTENEGTGVAIVVLNWNGWRDTIECLESLYRISYQDYEVILVDNCSTDDSVLRIREYCRGLAENKPGIAPNSRNGTYINLIEVPGEGRPAGPPDVRVTNELPPGRRLTLVKNDKNYGFAEGNNRGIRYALAQFDPAFVLILNNDTEVSPDFLTELVGAVKSCPGVGIAGPKSYYHEFGSRRDVINFAGGKTSFFTFRSYSSGKNRIDRGEFDTKMPVDYIEGSCLLIRSRVIREIGIFDPAFFMYWEDSDLCWRAKKYGYVSLYVPASIIWHKVGASFRSQKTNSLKIFYSTRNRFIFAKKNAGNVNKCIFLAYIVLYEFWVDTYLYVIRQRNPRGYLSFLSGLKSAATMFERSDKSFPG